MVISACLSAYKTTTVQHDTFIAISWQRTNINKGKLGHHAKFRPALEDWNMPRPPRRSGGATPRWWQEILPCPAQKIRWCDDDVQKIGWCHEILPARQPVTINQLLGLNALDRTTQRISGERFICSDVKKIFLSNTQYIQSYP